MTKLDWITVAIIAIVGLAGSLIYHRFADFEMSAFDWLVGPTLSLLMLPHVLYRRERMQNMAFSIGGSLFAFLFCWSNVGVFLGDAIGITAGLLVSIALFAFLLKRQRAGIQKL